MKKLNIFLMSLIMLVSSVAFTGCVVEEPEGETPTYETAFLMNGFEDFSSQIQSIKLFNGFGQVHVNTDLKYVKSGKQSIQLRPNGRTYYTARPMLSVPTYNLTHDYGYADFTDVKKVLVSAYNAEDHVVKMGVCLGKAGPACFFDDTQGRTPCEYFDLQPGWNEIEYSIVPAYMSYGPLEDFSIKSVHSICFEFEYLGSKNIEDADTIYLDDIYLIKHAEDATEEEKFGQILPLKSDAEKGVWEIADFEDPLQAYFFSFTGGFSIMPTVEVVSSVDCGIVPTSGTNMLQFIQRSGQGEQGGAAITRICGEAIRMALANIGDDIKQHPENYEFKMDVFNSSNSKASIALFSFNAYSAEQNKYFGSSKYLPREYESGVWTTFSVNLGEIEDSMALDGDVKSIYFGETDKYIPDYIRMYMGGFASATDISDRVLYFDNIRIEKVATETE